MNLATLQPGVWYPVIQTPRVNGRPLSALDGDVWLLVKGHARVYSAGLLDVVDAAPE